ncbi:MAG: tRNA (guanosine(46)-N7)-methyltransferase TrmB [Clostridia bacterium]|nr:tRNA (guanosine(46)-N7)-methyltransferase TrmB [Clostridia bacterium]
MRMRTRKHLGERMEECGELFIDIEKAPEGEFFTHPLHLEIGCGKGRFITELAAQNPEIHYIAAEMIDNVLVLAAEKAKAAELENVRFVSGNVKNLALWLPEGSVDRIYLNFSDPWPKKGHAKRRLTHKNFLDLYKRILVPNGEIHFKTDNLPLFEFSIQSFEENGFELSEVTYDLHNSGFEGNIMTEYEERFSGMGFKINRLVARVSH